MPVSSRGPGGEEFWAGRPLADQGLIPGPPAVDRGLPKPWLIATRTAGSSPGVHTQELSWALAGGLSGKAGRVAGGSELGIRPKGPQDPLFSGLTCPCLGWKGGAGTEVSGVRTGMCKVVPEGVEENFLGGGTPLGLERLQEEERRSPGKQPGPGRGTETCVCIGRSKPHMCL